MLTSGPEFKLYHHLAEKIISGQLSTFAGMVDYVRTLKPGFKTEKVLAAAFLLLKKMRWGFLGELDRAEYGKLWKELVLPHSEFEGAGDLKRNISIANIHIAMLDIHGYTRFCQESKSNLSRLRKLDEFLHEGVRRIARANHSLANRERGDEIVVVSPSATDCIQTTLEIINTFSKKSVVKEQTVGGKRSDYSIVLPDFKVTAGIAGGNLSTPLIITESGLLSGFLLNTAARLQTLANELSPAGSKVVTTNSVYSGFVKENKVVKSELFARELLRFFNIGPIAFKGIKVSCCEIVFSRAEHYRMSYNPTLMKLLESLRQKLWKGRILPESCRLVSEVCRAMPRFSVEVSDAEGRSKADNDSVRALAEQVLGHYEAEDYLSAVAGLRRVVDTVAQVPAFDRIVVRYLREIAGRYETLSAALSRRLEQEIDARVDLIFNPQYKTAYLNAKKYLGTYEKLKSFAMKSHALGNRKSIWYALIEDHRDELDLELYSGKR